MLQECASDETADGEVLDDAGRVERGEVRERRIGCPLVYTHGTVACTSEASAGLSALHGSW